MKLKKKILAILVLLAAALFVKPSIAGFTVIIPLPGISGTPPPPQSTINLMDGSMLGFLAVSSGDVYYWGVVNYKTKPVKVPGLSGVTGVAINYDAMYAMTSGGSVYAWGSSNSYGQLGNGTTSSSSIPAPVVGLSGATQIKAYNHTACALVSGGTISCWGSDPATHANDLVATPVGPFAAPVVDFALNGGSLCAVLSGGSVQCVGGNSWGTLGNGTYTSSSTPVAVKGLSGAKMIASSPSTYCAGTSTGVECWGG